MRQQHLLGLLLLVLVPLASGVLGSGVARAEPLPLESTVRVGHPERAVELHVHAADDGPQLDVRLGGRSATEALPARALTDATIERVEVADGHYVAIVRARGPEADGAAQIAAIVGASGGRPVILWTGRTDLHGDPGERSADVLTLEDRTGDDQPDLVVGVRREGATLCGEEQTLLLPRAYDPARGEMRPVTLQRFQDAEQVAVTATRQSPGPEGPPLLRALSVTGASSTAGHGEELSGLGPPRALTDDRTETYWPEGRGGPGRGEFATARWTARFPIRAIALRSPTGDAASELGHPQTLWLVGDEGPRLRVTIPEDPARHPGERFWIVPPEPLAWRCVSVVLDEAYAPAGTRDAAVHTAIAEVEAYTELDFGGGIDDLVAILVRGTEGGDEAARLLSGLGEPAVNAVASAWERLDEQGRRRAVRVFVANARRDVEPAVDALARAAMDDAEPVRTSALEALGTLGPRAGEYLAELVQAPAPVGDEAVRPLLRHEASIAVPALLSAIEVEGGSERPALREGLARALSGADEPARQRLEQWVEAEPSIAALASALLGLAAYGPTRPTARALVTDAALQRASRFEDRWRLVGATRQLPSDDGAIDAWLGGVASDAEEWMLRAAAVEALGRRDAPDRGDVALAALEDDYPRVRVQAIAVLDALDAGDDPVAQLAREDSWPMVREAAVTALWNRPGAQQVVRRAVRDRSPRVRQAAIAALTRAGDREAWPLVEARLEDGEEWPQVTVAALRYVSALCLRDAGPEVLGVLERGLAPNPWAPDVDVAAVAAALAVGLGGETAERARQMVDRPDAPASLRQAIERGAQSPPTACASDSGAAATP